MARVVKDVVVLLDDNNNEYRSITLDELGLSTEYARLIISYLNEDLNEFITELCINHNLNEFIDRENIIIKIQDFDLYQDEFENIYDIYKEKYPNKFKKTCNTLEQYGITMRYNVEVSDNFIDNKISTITFYSTDDDYGTFLRKYPLIPECVGMIYTKCTLNGFLNSIEDIITNLLMAKYFLSQLNKDESNENYNIMEDEIDDKLYEFEKDYPEEYEEVANNITFTIEETENVCNNIEKFANYELQKLVNNQEKDLLNELNEILLEAKGNNPNYNYIVNRISNFIKRNCSETEYNCFLKMCDNHNLQFIVSTFILSFHTFSSKDKYKDLFKENGGNQRTLNS